MESISKVNPERPGPALRDRATTLETTTTAQSQHKCEPNGRQVVEDCLGLPEILRRLLEHFSNKELIQVSLVNKLWNYEARSLLRDRGSLSARISAECACLNFAQFAADLQQMRVVPFTGIRVVICHYEGDIDTCGSLSCESLNPSCEVILDRLPLKHLSVVILGVWYGFKDCPAFFLVKRILEDHSRVLGEMSLKFSDCYFVEFLQSIFECWSFPCLKILKFPGPTLNWKPNSSYSADFVKTLVSCAPRLEKLYMKGRIIYHLNVMEGSSAVLVATSGLHPLREQVCESLIDALRTESVCVFRADALDFEVELLNKFVPMVLQASHTTLKTLRMDFLFAVPLMCYGICLENVTELEIFVSESVVKGIQLDILDLVKALDFTRVFPILDKVVIRGHVYEQLSSDDISAFVERGNAVSRMALLHRAINIRHLKLSDYRLPLSLLAQMFPHVKAISLDTRALQQFQFGLLWEHFGCLEELSVHFGGSGAAITTNLDSEFCGIYPEELAELREKDDEYLKAVNIVPVMPSITCMRGLRLFTLWYNESHATRKDSTRMFSKVTGLIGFPRCPDLSVKFQTSRYVPKALDHMKPYVTVVTEDRLR